MRKAAFILLASLAFATEGAFAEDDSFPDVRIVVFRHHPGLIDTKERMAARKEDEKIILQTVDAKIGSYTYGGGLGSGYELSVYARDLGRWKEAIDNLHNAGTLKYYGRWQLDRNGYGLVPVR